MEQELSRYIAMPDEALSSDPLNFWATNQGCYPSFAKVARSLLAIPATSTPSERLFSKAGHIVNSKRSLLSAKMVNQLSFLSSNIK
jgi:hypothetical protein